jgi:hypothetical protein
MNMKITHLAIAPTIALFALTSGCVTTGTAKDEPRLHVGFATAQSAQTFYETYLATYYPPRGGYFTVGVPLPYEHRKISTDNIYFNRAIQSADCNHDNVITEEEARTYAKKMTPTPTAARASAPASPTL